MNNESFTKNRHSILRRKDLNLIDKNLLNILIDFKQNGKGNFAGNEYFAELLGVSIATIKRSFKFLSDNDFIIIKSNKFKESQFYTERKVYVTNKWLDQNELTLDQNEPYIRNIKENKKKEDKKEDKKINNKDIKESSIINIEKFKNIFYSTLESKKININDLNEYLIKNLQLENFNNYNTDYKNIYQSISSILKINENLFNELYFNSISESEGGGWESYLINFLIKIIKNQNELNNLIKSNQYRFNPKHIEIEIEDEIF